MIDGFNPEFDDALWTLDWLNIPVAQIQPGDYEGGYRVTQGHVEEVDIFGRAYRMDPPLEVRLLHDPQGVLWMSDTPQERMMMYNNARQTRGHVLIGGAGLGLYPQYAAQAQSFTIVERSPMVARLVAPILKPLMDTRGIPLRFIMGDVRNYLKSADPGSFDTIFIDTWAHLDANLLPGINVLRDDAERHLAPGGQVLLWGYRWMVRMFEEASATLLMMDPPEREAWFEAQAAQSSSAGLLRPVIEAFRKQTIQRWELDAAVAECRAWVQEVKLASR